MKVIFTLVVMLVGGKCGLSVTGEPARSKP
jgi:hypothetical protein